MNKIIGLAIMALCVSCGSTVKKKNQQNTTSQNLIIFIRDSDGRSVAYTDDGHTMMITKDSIDNYIVYYSKFDITTEKNGADRFKEKLVRIETDSCLNTLKSIITVHGAAFFKKKATNYDVQYFDDQMNADSIKQIEIPSVAMQLKEKDNEDEITQIMILLHVAYQMACVINSNNVSGWNNIVYALEPSQNILGYNVVMGNKISDEKVKTRVSNINSATSRFTEYFRILTK